MGLYETFSLYLTVVAGYVFLHANCKESCKMLGSHATLQNLTEMFKIEIPPLIAR